MHGTRLRPKRWDNAATVAGGYRARWEWFMSADHADGGKLDQRLMDLIEPVVRSEGLILVELQNRPEPSGHVLRLFVDRPEGGVTLDECTLVSRQVSDLLDVEDVIPGAFRLEVSSPGLERRLKSRREYELFAGRMAKLVVSRGPEDGREILIGKLMGLQGDDVLIDIDGRVKAVPLDQVAKANLVLD